MSTGSAHAAAEDRRTALVAQRALVQPALPLRWWRQTAHLTVPGSDAGMVAKAIERGTAAMPRLLAAAGVTARDIARHVGVDPSAVERLLELPQAAPVVVIDLEDALTDAPEVREAGTRNAAEALSSPHSPVAPGRPLRFLRPPSLEESHAAAELMSVLAAASVPPDAVVLPKVRDGDDVELLLQLLTSAEDSGGRVAAANGSGADPAPGPIRVAVLIESGSAVLRLADIVERAGSRLAGLIFGPADFASDLGLPRVDAAHPTAVWARSQIVAAAASASVPAIDGMTFGFPVVDRQLDAAANRAAFLDRLAEVHADALAAHALGMAGKWVGHPAQLFMTLLAFESAVDRAQLEAAAASIERYAAAREQGTGATMIDGQMADVATDRHARMVLRRSTVNGWFDAGRALSLGVISAAERSDLAASTSTGA